MTPRQDIFQAIADTTRRQIINMIHQKPQTINSVAEKFDMSRQAVSLHIQILVNCGLITIIPKGRERHCEATLNRLNEVSIWIEQYKQYWESKLDSMENYLWEIQKKKNARRKR
jgi:DNA-binding transcriptional ArsR family regulator